MVDDDITTTKQNQKGVHILWDIPLKLKSCHDANFVNIGSTRGCHDDNLWCCQWWQNSNLSYDANVVPTTSTVGCHNNTHGVAGHNKILTWELSLCQLRYHWQHQIMIYSGVTNDDKIKTASLGVASDDKIETQKLWWCQLRYHWQHHIMTSSSAASDDKIENQNCHDANFVITGNTT